VNNAPLAKDEQLKRLYRETLLRHVNQPVGYLKSLNTTHRNEQFNPLCGDRVILLLEVTNSTILDAGFEGESCAICKASASMLCELAPGRSKRDMTEIRHWLESALAGDDRPGPHPDLQALLGVRNYPTRIDCARLPWKALEAALDGDRSNTPE